MVSSLAGGAGRSLRLSRTQRRRQKHHAEAADAADLPDRRPRTHSRPARGRPRCAPAHRLSPRESLFLRLPHGGRAAGYFARLFGYRGADVTARVARVLDEVGLAAERRMRLRQFSKGMLQRVGLAQALINDPEVVFLDEPMSGLDPLGRREVRDLILRLRARGCTVFFSSHILTDAEALCSRVAIMAQGRLVTSGRLTEHAGVRAQGMGSGRRSRQRRGQGGARAACAPSHRHISRAG